MLSAINPTTTKAWQQLENHYAVMKNVHLRDLFKDDPARFKKFSLCEDEIVFDYSKNIITEKTLKLLLQLAEECNLKEAMNAMFNGDIINGTEKRSVLHVALRNFSERPPWTIPNIAWDKKVLSATCATNRSLSTSRPECESRESIFFVSSSLCFSKLLFAQA